MERIGAQIAIYITQYTIQMKYILAYIYAVRAGKTPWVFTTAILLFLTSAACVPLCPGIIWKDMGTFANSILPSLLVSLLTLSIGFVLAEILLRNYRNDKTKTHLAKSIVYSFGSAIEFSLTIWSESGLSAENRDYFAKMILTKHLNGHEISINDIPLFYLEALGLTLRKKWHKWFAPLRRYPKTCEVVIGV